LHIEKLHVPDVAILSLSGPKNFYIHFPLTDIRRSQNKKKPENIKRTEPKVDYSQVDMRGEAHEAVFIYCECAATKQIGLPRGEKVSMILNKDFFWLKIWKI